MDKNEYMNIGSGWRARLIVDEWFVVGELASTPRPRYRYGAVPDSKPLARGHGGVGKSPARRPLGRKNGQLLTGVRPRYPQRPFRRFLIGPVGDRSWRIGNRSRQESA